MLVFTIIMVFLFLITIFISEMAKSVYKNKDKTPEKDFNNQIGAVGCFMAIFTIPYLVAYFIYILKLLTIDPLFYPSAIMLGIYIIEMIIAVAISIFKKNKEVVSKTHPATIVIRGITAMFYMYALYILIVGI